MTLVDSCADRGASRALRARAFGGRDYSPELAEIVSCCLTTEPHFRPSVEAILSRDAVVAKVRDRRTEPRNDFGVFVCRLLINRSHRPPASIARAGGRAADPDPARHFDRPASEADGAAAAQARAVRQALRQGPAGSARSAPHTQPLTTRLPCRSPCLCADLRAFRRSTCPHIRPSACLTGGQPGANRLRQQSSRLPGVGSEPAPQPQQLQQRPRIDSDNRGGGGGGGGGLGRPRPDRGAAMGMADRMAASLDSPGFAVGGGESSSTHCCTHCCTLVHTAVHCCTHCCTLVHTAVGGGESSSTHSTRAPWLFVLLRVPLQSEELSEHPSLRVEMSSVGREKPDQRLGVKPTVYLLCTPVRRPGLLRLSWRGRGRGRTGGRGPGGRLAGPAEGPATCCYPRRPNWWRPNWWRRRAGAGPTFVPALSASTKCCCGSELTKSAVSHRTTGLPVAAAGAAPRVTGRATWAQALRPGAPRLAAPHLHGLAPRLRARRQR